MPGGWIGEARATGGAAETSSAEQRGTDGAAFAALPAAGDAPSALAAAFATAFAFAFAFPFALALALATAALAPLKSVIL